MYVKRTLILAGFEGSLQRTLAMVSRTGGAPPRALLNLTASPYVVLVTGVSNVMRPVS